MSPAKLLLIAAALLAAPAQAAAVCGGGTVAQEYAEATIVVRARLVSQTDVWDDEPSGAFEARWGDGSLVSLYGLKVLQVFKGAPRGRVAVFMPHDSGAFYLDIDKDYLLFLDQIPPYRGRPAAAAKAFTVKYACGQSKPWAEVKPGVLEDLHRRSGR